jgi:multicomponent Na+:H+ antiporter subunit C
MTLAIAAVAAVLFGAGSYLLLQRSLIRVVAGIALISQCAIVTIIGSSLSEGRAAIDPEQGGPLSDPLPQALALTALVIGMGTLALLLALVHRVVVAHGTAERDELRDVDRPAVDDREGAKRHEGDETE